MKNSKNKIMVILGPTSGGKTKLAVDLARKFSGEIVSADSRQVYKGMDIGTGKDLSEYKIGKIKIKYYLIDVVNPKTDFNLAKYQKLAYKAIDDILARGKTPIIAGGTGLYIQAVIDGYQLPGGKPDKKLRARLEKMNAEKLFAMLKKLDSKKAESLNESERGNKRRLIRYIEVARMTTKKFPPPPFNKEGSTKRYDFLLVGLTFPKEILEKRIYQRLIERLKKEDMIAEVKRLREEGVSWKRLDGFGLEYRYVSLYLRGKLTYDEMVEKLNIAIRQFAKHQMTWFKRDKRIKWIKNKSEVNVLVKKFLK